MYQLLLLALACLPLDSLADGTFFYKAMIGKRSRFSDIFRNLSQIQSVLRCGRYCKDIVNCRSANFCGNDCELSNRSTNRLFYGLEDDPACIYIEMTELCKSVDNKKTCVRKVSCPIDFTLIGDLCVKYYKEKMNYSTANQTCIARGGHLLTLRNGSDMHSLIANCQPEGCHHMWIDGKDFQTWDGKPIPYENWDKNTTMVQGECPVMCANKNVMKGKDCEATEEAYCQVNPN